MYPQLERLICSHLNRDIVKLKNLQSKLITMIKGMEQLPWEMEELWPGKSEEEHVNGLAELRGRN